MSDALQQRNALKRKKPHFRRQDSHKIKKLDGRWRRPKGRHSKMRLRKKSYARHVECGWGSPSSVSGLTREGLQPVLVHTVREVMTLDPKTQGAVVGGKVGARKKAEVLKAAQEKKVKVLNVKESYLTKQEEAFKQRQAARKEWEKKRAAKKETNKESKKAKEEKLTKEEEKKELDKVLTQTQ